MWRDWVWLDPLRNLWTRWTVCRRHGHSYDLDADYCENCGKNL